MMKSKVVIGSVATVLVIAAVGGGYAVYKRKGAVEAGQTREHLEAALNNMKARAENPDQKPFKEKNLTELVARLAPSLSAVERAKSVQAGIVFFDLDNGKSWSAEQYNTLGSELLTVLAEKSNTPEEKRLHILSFQLLKRVMPHVTSAEVVKKLDVLVAGDHGDAYERALYIDLASLPPEPSALFLEAQGKCLASKDAGVAQSCIQMIEQVQNVSVREKAAKRLLAKWPSLQEPLQPYAVKTLISQHAFFENEAQGLLKTVSEKKGEVWSDVFIFGVAELKAVDQYRTQLTKIRQSAEAITLRQRAEELLK